LEHEARIRRRRTNSRIGLISGIALDARHRCTWHPVPSTSSLDRAGEPGTARPPRVNLLRIEGLVPPAQHRAVTSGVPSKRGHIRGRHRRCPALRSRQAIRRRRAAGPHRYARHRRWQPDHCSAPGHVPPASSEWRRPPAPACGPRDVDGAAQFIGVPLVDHLPHVPRAKRRPDRWLAQ